jgi:hypothetical protein
LARARGGEVAVSTDHLYTQAPPAMPAEPSEQPGSSAPDAADAARRSSTSSNKRRRTSDRSSLTIPESSDANHARGSASPRALIQNSPQMAPGSSRDMTPPPEGSGSIKYTRTGRVSKATKGQRVHHCEDCGKVSACLDPHCVGAALPSSCLTRFLAALQSVIRPTMQSIAFIPAQYGIELTCSHRHIPARNISGKGITSGIFTHRTLTMTLRRRHQQNHKPGAFPCEIPGCGRSFYREDLLLRHKARQFVSTTPLLHEHD